MTMARFLSIEGQTYTLAVDSATVSVLLQSLSCPLKVLILSCPNKPTLHLSIQKVLSPVECFIQWSSNVWNALHALSQLSTADLISSLRTTCELSPCKAVSSWR